MTYKTLKAAVAETGRVSKGNSKMPGSTFAIDAFRCNVGSRLAEVEGSTCSRCYARKLQKLRPSVNQGWSANHDKAVAMIDADPERWAQGMAFQILRLNKPEHRWFDSGDLQSVAMLDAIVMVARMTPNVRHWLPTREAALVRKWAATGTVPANLTIRLSAPMVDDTPTKAPKGIVTSTVHRKGSEHVGHACPASTQGNQCGDCRACWSTDVPNVSYPLH